MSTFIKSIHDETLLQVHISCPLTKSNVPAIIIAHPYGPLGGNMNNNVVIAMQRHFVSKGYITACLNFRGCGKSQGRTSWTGQGERADYMSVMNYLLDKYPNINQLVLSGYSYGAMIANSIECTKVPCAYLLVSLPLGVMWALATTKMNEFKKQPISHATLCIHGDHDQFTRASTFLNWCQGHSNITHICIEGADHFWYNHEPELIDQINHWSLNIL